jgi:hypothetical protein
MNRRPIRAIWLRGAAGALGLAVIVSGLGFAAASGDEPKQENKKAEPKKDQPKDQPQKDKVKKNLPGPDEKDFEEIFKNLPQGADPDQLRQMQAEIQRMMQQMRGQFPGGLQGGAGFGGFAMPHEGRLGVRVQTPNATLVDQLDLPKGQGLVVEDVQAESAAAKAGIKNHDILLELNGKAVHANPAEFVRSLRDVKADTPVDVVVLRKGKRETIKGLSLPEAKAEAAQQFFNGLPPKGGQGGFGGGGGIGLPPGGVLPNPPGFPGGGGFAGAAGGFGGGQQVMTSVFRTDDRFTTRHQEGSLVITVTGTIADGKAKVSSIKVQDARESHEYASLDKVAEQYRDKVKNLIEMSEKSGVRIEIKTPKIEP